MEKLFLISLLIFLSISCGSSSSSTTTTTEESSSTATYTITFSTSWDSSSHPTDFPSNAHFSPLIGLTHNSSTRIWEEGQLASSGMESMAETGATSLLTSEINELIQSGSAKSLIQGNGISSLPNSTSVTIEVSTSHSLVSLVTMIAPSPDWFIGIDSIDLIENGSFVNTKTIELQPYDSGSDSGSNYTSSNSDTQPKEAISKITGDPLSNNGSVAPLGTFTFIKQ